MVVCKCCLEEIESHEGYQWSRKVSDNELTVCGEFDDEGNFIEDEYGSEECIKCEWCDEYVNDVMYEI